MKSFHQERDGFLPFQYWSFSYRLVSWFVKVPKTSVSCDFEVMYSRPVMSAPAPGPDRVFVLPSQPVPSRPNLPPGRAEIITLRRVMAPPGDRRVVGENRAATADQTR